MLLGWLSWAVLATPAHAQPEAMPITVLDNRDAAVIQPDATDPSCRGNTCLEPQPMSPRIRSHRSKSPAPSIAPPAGAIALPNPQVPQAAVWTAPWTWQVLPDGLMFKNYLASNEEGRLGSQLYYDKKIGWTWDGSLGGHVGILRYGTQDPAWPEGWQLDVDGVALPRLDSTRSMVSTDFRIGFPLTHREGPWEFKFGYYHLSSHLGDLYMLVPSRRDAAELCPRATGVAAWPIARSATCGSMARRIGPFTRTAVPSRGSSSSASTTVPRSRTGSTVRRLRPSTRRSRRT